MPPCLQRFRKPRCIRRKAVLGAQKPSHSIFRLQGAMNLGDSLHGRESAHNSTKTMAKNYGGFRTTREIRGLLVTIVLNSTDPTKLVRPVERVVFLEVATVQGVSRNSSALILPTSSSRATVHVDRHKHARTLFLVVSCLQPRVFLHCSAVSNGSLVLQLQLVIDIWGCP